MSRLDLVLTWIKVLCEKERGDSVFSLLLTMGARSGHNADLAKIDKFPELGLPGLPACNEALHAATTISKQHNLDTFNLQLHFSSNSQLQ